MNKKLATLLVLASLTVAGATFAVSGPASETAALGAGTMMDGAAPVQVDPAIREKMQRFYKDTEGLRKQIFMKRAELNAVINAAQADPATAGKMAGELYDLQANLRQQAQAAGLGQFRPGCGMGMGMGMGRGMGMGGGFGRGIDRW